MRRRRRTLRRSVDVVDVVGGILLGLRCCRRDVLLLVWFRSGGWES